MIFLPLFYVFIRANASVRRVQRVDHVWEENRDFFAFILSRVTCHSWSLSACFCSSENATSIIMIVTIGSRFMKIKNDNDNFDLIT